MFNDIAATLRAWRAAARLDQTDIADECRCSRALVSAWELGRTEIPDQQLVRFGRLCGRSDQEIGEVVLHRCGLANRDGNASKSVAAA